MISAVLDTNVLVSAAIKQGGKPYQIMALAEERFTLVTSAFILSEMEAVLARKHIQARYRKRVTPERRDRVLNAVRHSAALVEVKTTLSAVSEDAKDNPVLACALDGRADYLVTGDRHLLALGAYQHIQIVTPAEFLELLSRL